MTDTTIDYQAVFRSLPGILALLTPEGVILDVNHGFLDASGREPEQLLGRNIFDEFPSNPDDPGSVGPASLRASFDTVIATGESHIMSPARYDVEDLGRPGSFEERYWIIVNAPLWRGGRVTMIAHKADEVTHIINQGRKLRAGQG